MCRRSSLWTSVTSETPSWPSQSNTHWVVTQFVCLVLTIVIADKSNIRNFQLAHIITTCYGYSLGGKADLCILFLQLSSWTRVTSATPIWSISSPQTSKQLTERLHCLVCIGQESHRKLPKCDLTAMQNFRPNWLYMCIFSDGQWSY